MSCSVLTSIRYYIILCIATNAQAKLITQLTGLVAHPGHRVEIQCHLKPNSNLSEWTFAGVGQSIPITLFSEEKGLNYQLTKKFSFIHEDKSVLLLSTVNAKEDAGTYRCKMLCLAENQIDEDVTELIVIDEHLKCSSSHRGPFLLEGESLALQCVIRWWGNWAPNITWNSSDSENRGQVTTEPVDNSSIVSQLKLVTNRSMNKMTLSFRLWFTIDNYFGEKSSLVNHCSNYVDEWTSPQLNVYYKPETPRISPSGEKFHVGDVLLCTSDSNPKSTYHWMDISSGITSTGSEIRLEEHMTRSPSASLMCRATNSVGNASVVKNVIVQKRDDFPVSSVAAIVASGVLFLLLLATLVYLMCTRKNEGRRNTEAKVEDDPTNVVENSNAVTQPAVSYHLESDTYESIGSESLSQSEQLDQSGIETTGSMSYTHLKTREIPVPSVYNRLRKDNDRSWTDADSKHIEASVTEHEYVNSIALMPKDYYNVNDNQ